MSEAEASAAHADRRSMFARMAQFGRAAMGVVLDTALPPMCASCRAPLGNLGGLCPACWSRVSFIAPPYCERLGLPFAYDPGPGILSMEAIADPPAYGRARAAVRYDDVARDLIHRLKYGDRLDLATTMGRWMARAGRELIEEADALLPVPLHWRRLWGRRFNQAAALANVVAAGRALPVLTGALRRVRATPQQVGLSRSERAVNVQGAFDLTQDGKAAIHGQRLVLVDDVLTSGATVDTCARALLRAGARNVDVLVFARVVAAVRPPI
jgi:ComF family protein